LQQPLTVPLPHTLTRPPDRFRRRSRIVRWAMAVAVLLAVFVAVPVAFYWGQQLEDEEAPALNSPDVFGLDERMQREGIEIEDQIQALRTHTDALEADINFRNAPDPGDQIAAEIQRLLQEASLLEQEVQFGAAGAPPSLSNHPYYGR